MRKSITTWRLSFISLPTDEQLDQVRALLEPILRVEKPDDYGHIFREFGQSDHLMIAPDIEATAGEIALDCLLRAHRLGKGWRILWPEAVNEEETVVPEFLDGLTGRIEDGRPFVKMSVPGLYMASFMVTVIPEAAPDIEKTKTAASAGMPRRPFLDLVTFRVYVKPAMEKILAGQRHLPWSWIAASDASALGMLGFRLTGEEDDEMFFAGADKTTATLKRDGDAVESVEFVLSALPDPHLLDEVTFTERQNEYEALFHNAVNHLEMYLGPPSFAGASGDTGFPGDRWADWAATWLTDQYRVIIEQRHNDKELPMELCLVFMPLKAVL
jgi:hypothetical protein